MKFFIPFSDSSEQQRTVYDHFVKIAHDAYQVEVYDNKIYSLTYKHNGITTTAIVGKQETSNNMPPNQTVYAIIPCSLGHLIYTDGFGVRGDRPILVGPNEYVSSIPFDP